MKQSKIYRKLLSVALAAIMVLSLTNGMSVGKARAAEEGQGKGLTWEQVENNGNGLLYEQNRRKAELFEENYVKNGMVRASIVLLDAATLKKYDAKNIAANAAAKSYRESLREKQDALAAKISNEVLGGEKLDVVWNITLAGNIISANIPYDKLEAIKNVIGVKDVVLETSYEPAVASKEGDDPNMSTASEMVGSDYAWADGYTGAGSKIAIVDTGLDIEHELFQGSALEESLKDKNVSLLTAADVAEKFSQLNASQFLTSAEGVYRNPKVPYGINYVDTDLDILHINDKQGEHGSHVAGIAAGNSLIPDGNGGFKDALKTVKTHGQAPDAQLIIMKVFGKGGGAYDSDYMVAIEDAIVLGADAVNLSLGSASAGFVTNSTYADILNEVAEAANLVWVNSASNSYSWAQYSNPGYLYADDVNFDTSGSPGTYATTLSVASVINKGQTGIALEAQGVKAIYSETSGYNNAPITSIPGEYDYVLLDGPGVGVDPANPDVDANNNVGKEGDQFWALGEDIVKGKVAFCFRGTSSFFAKANAAAAQGAIAVVIINNQPGVINMNLSGYNYTAPAVSILQADGLEILSKSELNTDANGNEYYTGKVKISDTVGVSNPGDDFTYEMSEFSSWGVPGDLSLKPEITAPGGNIYSVFGYSKDTNGNIQGGHDKYENMSGTSMASPQVAGLVAVLAQYFRENDLTTKTGMTARQLAISLLMSTSEPMLDEYGEHFPVIQQGSGLANVNNAINAKSYITMDKVAEKAPASAAASISEGKVKAELGEVQGDSFTVEFTLHNFSDEAVSYYLSADFFTQYIYYNYYRLGWIDYLTLSYEWEVDGEEFEPADAALYDFNGDGVANGKDALYLLDYCAGLVEEAELFNADMADLDMDGDIDTYDARLAFEMLNGASLDVEAGKDTKVKLTVSGLESAAALNVVNGNYIEGYIYALEGETADGALGVEHSIPVLGFYGNWTDASMYDKSDVLEYLYGEDNGLNPYLYEVTGGLENPYFKDYIVNGDYFYGNPVAFDTTLDDPETFLYLPERNALGKNTVVNSVQYTQIRNAGAGRFYVTDQYGNIVTGTETRFGRSYSAYYHVNQQTWVNAGTVQALNFVTRTLKENKSYTLNYELAPEYYVNPDGSVRWDELGEGVSYTLDFVVDNTAPYIVDGAYDEAEQNISIMAHDNQWISAVALYTQDGDLIDYYGGIADLKKGEQYTYDFDLSEVLTGEETDPAHFLVEVYDYALNLATFKLNLNSEEANDPISVEIDQDEDDALIVNNGTLQLTATVLPWAFADEELEWTSSDESIATVDENGLVTSVGTEDATVTITATSMADPKASDSIEVTIFFVHKNLNGFVWDEEGEVWASEFDVATLPEYTKLNARSLRLPLASAAYDEEGTLYVSSMSEWNGNEILYTMDTETWTLTSVGELEFAIVDFCQAPSLEDNFLLAVYAYYVLIIDKTTGKYLGAFNFANYTGGNYLVGIAYEEQYFNSNYQTYVDYVFLLDQTGTVYEVGFLPYGGDYANFRPSTIGRIGPSVDTPFWQSFYYDGTSLFWSRYSEAENDVDIIMVNDLYHDGSIYNLGSFAASVWPVGGLFELGIHPYFGKLSTADHSDAVLDEDTVMETTIELVYREGLETSKTPAGSLNAKAGDGGKGDTNKLNTEVTVEITADELTKNGYFLVEYPDTVELISATSPAEFQSWNGKEEGKLILAFVDLEGIEADGTLLKLVFSKESEGTVTITTTDINEDDEKELIETVVLGTASHNIHTYGEPVWEWAEDFSSATATFTCPVEGDTQVVEATVTIEDNEETGMRKYTATVEFEGKTYTDTKEEKLAWTWKRLSGEDRFDTMSTIVDEAYKEDHTAL